MKDITRIIVTLNNKVEMFLSFFLNSLYKWWEIITLILLKIIFAKVLDVFQAGFLIKVFLIKKRVVVE